MPLYQVEFLFGPCNGRKESFFWAGVPPTILKCGGQDYRKESAPDPHSIKYVLDSADVLYRPEPIPGQRDMWRAWSRLHSALNSTTRRQVLRTRAASRGIRRAVK